MSVCMTFIFISSFFNPAVLQFLAKQNNKRPILALACSSSTVDLDTTLGDEAATEKEEGWLCKYRGRAAVQIDAKIETHGKEIGKE